MDYQTLHAKTVVELRALARELHVKVPAGTNKQRLVELLLEAGTAKTGAASQAEPGSKPTQDAAPKRARPGRPPRASAAEDGWASETESAPQSDSPATAPKTRARSGKGVHSAAGTTRTSAAQKPASAAGTQAGAPGRKAAPSSRGSGEAGTPRTSGDSPAKQHAGGVERPGDAAPADQGSTVSDAGQDAVRAANPIGAQPPQDPGVTERAKPAVQPNGSVTPSATSAGRPGAAQPARSAAIQPESAPAPVQPGLPGEPRQRVPAQRRDAARQDVSRGAKPVQAEDRARRADPPRQGRPQPGSPENRGGRVVLRHGPNGTALPRRATDPTPTPRRADAGENRAPAPFAAQKSRAYEPAQAAPRPYAGEPMPSAPNSRVGEPLPSAPVAPKPRRFESVQPAESAVEGEGRGRRENPAADLNPAVTEMLAAGEGGDGAGVLELQPDGYGFLRAENCLPGPNDVYISIAQIRRFNLRTGDYVEGKTRPQREGDRYSAIMYITRVNGLPPEEAANRPRFEDLVPVYPDQRLRLERPGGALSLRLVDMLAPIGKGQRGMIVSPPKAGKTTLLKQIANAITAGYPDMHLIVLLIDERPEEVTDMQRSIDGEVVYSTFDEMPENHTRVAEMVLARAQRLVEAGKDVVVLMDSITRLARAYNLVIAPTGRSLSGGLDPGALFKPKRFFGAARNIENGGSLTIVATALVDTGSRMDDIIYEEFKGTGNMELHLDRKLSDRRVFPAIDMVRSGTRREELLLTEEEQAGEMQVRRMLGSGKDPEMPEQIISLMTRTRSNEDFFQRLQGWIAVAEKDGYNRGR